MPNKLTLSTRIASIEELEKHLSKISNLNNYSLISYIWHEYGFFPIYFNELFTEYFNDISSDQSIGICFAGHELFYEGIVDELLILDGFTDTRLAYENSAETDLLKQNFKTVKDPGIAFWHTIRNFDEKRFKKVIDQYTFKSQLFPIGDITTWKNHLFPGPRDTHPYMYAKAATGKEYWLPKNVNSWQTHRRLGWNINNWNAYNDFPRVIAGDYIAVFVKNSWKTRVIDRNKPSTALVGKDGDSGTPGFGFMSSEFVNEIVNYCHSINTQVVIIHDLVEYKLEKHPLTIEVKMERFFDTKRFLSIVHHSKAFISSATSPIDLASYYCNTNLVLIDDRGEKLDWVTKVCELRGKKCTSSNSRTPTDLNEVTSFLKSLDTPNTEQTRKLNIGGTEAKEGWEVLNGRYDEYVDHIGDASDLSRFQDKTFDIIYSSHTLEHIGYWESLIPTLKEWRRVLKDNGRILVSVPDLDVLTKLFSNRERLTGKQRYSLMRIIYGGQYNSYDFHYGGFNQEIMRHFVSHSGLKVVQRVKDFNIFNDTSKATYSGEAISLNVVIEKK